MPLDELLTLYGYRDLPENGTDEDTEQAEPMDEQESETDPPDQESKLSDLYENMPENDQDASRLLRCNRLKLFSVFANVSICSSVKSQ